MVKTTQNRATIRLEIDTLIAIILVIIIFLNPQAQSRINSKTYLAILLAGLAMYLRPDNTSCWSWAPSNIAKPVISEI